MTEIKMFCTSCKKRITNDPARAVFTCPDCKEEEIIRCSDCRKIGVKYKCQKCGFVGPN